MTQGGTADERRPVSLGDRWRREVNRGVDAELLDLAHDTLPDIRTRAVRVRPGSVHAELEGIMGSIHEVHIHAPVLPSKIWPQVARVLRRSSSMLEALGQGRVPRSFDRLVARIAGEPIFPEARRVTFACTCSEPLRPCHHIMALHELFARRLDERPWELLVMRGVDLRDLLEQARRTSPDESLPPLAYGAHEEPILFPEGEEGDLETILTRGQVASLLGVASPQVEKHVYGALLDYVEQGNEPEPPQQTA
jgi:uncharacterized Zn finger protein